MLRRVGEKLHAYASGRCAYIFPIAQSFIVHTHYVVVCVVPIVACAHIRVGLHSVRRVAAEVCRIILQRVVSRCSGIVYVVSCVVHSFEQHHPRLVSCCASLSSVIDVALEVRNADIHHNWVILCVLQQIFLLRSVPYSRPHIISSLVSEGQRLQYAVVKSGDVTERHVREIVSPTAFHIGR